MIQDYLEDMFLNRNHIQNVVEYLHTEFYVRVIIHYKNNHLMMKLQIEYFGIHDFYYTVNLNVEQLSLF